MSLAFLSHLNHTIMADKEIKLSELKEAYNNALLDNKESFIFKGNELLVDYAKYVIEFMESIDKSNQTPRK